MSLVFKFSSLKPGDKFIYLNCRFEKLNEGHFPIENDPFTVQCYNARFRSGPYKNKFVFILGDTTVDNYDKPIDGIFEDATGRFFRSVTVNVNGFPKEVPVIIQRYIL